MRRGEVRWYRFAAPDKRRPVLLLTRTSALEYLGEVTVAPITSTVRHIPSELELGPDDGMPKQCAANFDDRLAGQEATTGVGPLLIATPRAGQQGGRPGRGAKGRRGTPVLRRQA